MGADNLRPELEPWPDLALASQTLAAFLPRDEEQARAQDRILEFIGRHPEDAHRRSCVEGHLTASVLLWNSTHTKVLLHHHRKLGRWLQFGGHCDGDANLLGCAWRELVEESGIEPESISPIPVDLDIHAIPAHGEEPRHLHYDVRFLAQAGPGALAACSEESLELRWVSPTEAATLDLDDSVQRLLALKAVRTLGHRPNGNG
ncbi:MAG: NUDIX hydrolase [Planctomycetota bacterium]|nr:NUDIX hydrolase [Planctomycetota bacterium]